MKRLLLAILIPFMPGCITLDLPTKHGTVSVQSDGHGVLFGFRTGGPVITAR